MRSCKCRIGNEQQSKGNLGLLIQVARMQTDSATAARAKQPSLGQADVVFLWEGGLFSKGPEPRVQGWGWEYVSLFPVLSHCFTGWASFFPLPSG